MFVRFIVAFLFLAVAVEAFAGPFSIKVTQNPRHGDMISDILITSKTGQVIKKIEQQGFVQNMRYNKARTICAINCTPGSHINTVHVIIATPSGKIRVFEYFDHTIGYKLIDIDPYLPSSYLEVDRIVNRTFVINAGTTGDPHYEFRVVYTKQGDFRIVRKSITKLD